MSLTAGAQIGPYEILEPLGVGGMGEVYRARDTRLNRTVAIKILSDHLSTDSQFRERFEREARAISQLTHPHTARRTTPFRRSTMAAGRFRRTADGSHSGRPLDGSRPFDISPDGQRFLMSRSVQSVGSSQPPIVIVWNWSEDLKARVPAQ